MGRRRIGREAAPRRVHVLYSPNDLRADLVGGAAARHVQPIPAQPNRLPHSAQPAASRTSFRSAPGAPGTPWGKKKTPAAQDEGRGPARHRRQAQGPSPAARKRHRASGARAALPAQIPGQRRTMHITNEACLALSAATTPLRTAGGHTGMMRSSGPAQPCGNSERAARLERREVVDVDDHVVAGGGGGGRARPFLRNDHVKACGRRTAAAQRRDLAHAPCGVPGETAPRSAGRG